MLTGARAVVLIGTIGSGKTTLAEAISEELHARRARHALLDLDWLGQVYPTPEGHDPYGYELALRNLKDVWPNFQAAGARRAVVAGTLLNEDHRSCLQEALGLLTAVVLVEAPREVREDRIRSRNSGRLLADFLDRTSQLAADIEAAAIHDVRVLNHERPPTQVAEEILQRLGWFEDYD